MHFCREHWDTGEEAMTFLESILQDVEGGLLFSLSRDVA
jgi:hypothetical protein